MQPIVFMIGPDRCGKTEIGKALSKRLGVPYYKAAAERTAFVSNQDRFINDIRYSCPARLDLLKQLGAGVVYDRGYPCEWVYSRFFERQTDETAITWLDEQYAEMGAVIVICHRQKGYAGIVDDLDPNIEVHALNELHDLYWDFSKVTKCRVLKLAVDDENLDRELADIINFMELT